LFDWFRDASPTRQLQLAIAGVCILSAVLAGIWFAFLRTSYMPLFSDLRPADAASIVSVLDREKVPYRLANGGATILVPEDVVDSTRLNVMSQDVPLKGTVGFELFNKSDMGITDFAQKINYQRALQGELERTIMALDHVDTARVHLSLGEDRLFREDRVPPKASVIVRMAKDAKLVDNEAKGIKRLVAAAVPGLDAANVVILDEDGNVVGDAEPARSTADAAPQVQEQRAVEEYYEARIREALNHGASSAPVAVSVRADLAAAGQDVLSGWSPAMRQFPLRVTLSTAALLDQAAQDGLRAAAALAIASTTAQADMIAFGPPPALPAAAIVVEHPPALPAPLPMIAGGAASNDDDRNLLIDSGIVLLGLLAMFVGAALVLRRMRERGRLSERRRLDFIAKLQTALREVDGHAAQQS
jgi:flagellar M-ring protein FliF